METNPRIFKYTVEDGKIHTQPIIKILDVDFQPDFQNQTMEVQFWALVIPDGPVTERRVAVLATGQEVPMDFVETHEHIKTIQTVEPRMTPDGVVPKSVISHVFLERVGGVN